MSNGDNHIMLPIAGGVDTHVHSSPDVVARKLDDFELVEQARDAGMSALVLKSHCGSTCERAYLLNKIYPDFCILGGLVLNDSVGGFNPWAVETALKLGARQIWMPTKSAANHCEQLGGKHQGLRIGDGQSISEDVVTILRMIADADVVLATGHLSPEESWILIQEALDIGVRRISVTHPEWSVTAFSIEMQLKLAKSEHVYFERCLVSTQTDLPGHVEFETIVRQTRAVGIDSTVLATDYGMPHYPSPVEGMHDYIARLLDAGFSIQEITVMFRENPSKLLRIQERTHCHA